MQLWSVCLCYLPPCNDKGEAIHSQSRKYNHLALALSMYGHAIIRFTSGNISTGLPFGDVYNHSSLGLVQIELSQPHVGAIAWLPPQVSRLERCKGTSMGIQRAMIPQRSWECWLRIGLISVFLVENSFENTHIFKKILLAVLSSCSQSVC